jgi:hypothetical protein
VASGEWSSEVSPLLSSHNLRRGRDTPRENSKLFHKEPSIVRSLRGSIVRRDLVDVCRRLRRTQFRGDIILQADLIFLFSYCTEDQNLDSLLESMSQ